MHRMTYFAIGLLFAAGVAASQRGALPVEVFDVQAMEGASVSSDIAEQADGRLLVANMRGLFRFDGARWALHLHPEAKGGMEHLAVGADGRIHSSFNGDIGYWQDDSSGTLQWHSALQRLPADCRDVAAEVMSLHRLPARGGVVFAAATRIAWVPDDPQAPVLCRPMQQLIKTFHADGDLLMMHGAPPALSHLDAEFTPAPVPGSELLDGIGVNDSVDIESGTLLLNNNGQLLLYRNGALELWSDALLDAPGRGAARPFSTIELLADGRIAVAGVLDGIFVLGTDGRLVDHYVERDGVPVRRKTLGLYTDRSGDLWLAQERTLARIAATSALTVFDDRHGLPSAAQLAHWQGALWVASRSGLFQMRETAGGGEFHAPLPELLNLYGVAALTHDVLLVSNSGLHAVRRAETGWAAEQLPLAWSQIGVLEASRFVPGRVYAGYAQGLLQIDQGDDGRIKVSEIGALKMPVLRIAELDADTLWVADRVDGVLRVELADGANPRRYGEAQGLPAGTVRSYSGPRQAWFTTMLGLRVYDAASDRFIAPPGLPAELQQDRLYSAYEDHEGHLWVRGGAILNDVFWREGDSWRIDRDLLHGVDPFPTIFGFEREGDVVWAVRANGLLRIDLAAHRPTPPPPAPLLTRVFDTRTRAALALNGLVELTPTVRDLRIDFALPVLRRGSATAYRSRLAGFEEWTEWTASGQQARIYTNLPDGQFQFEVEARDALQRQVRMSPAALTIPPPWFRSAAAQTAYAGSALLALWGAMRIGARRRQLQMLVRQSELEAIVAARTTELQASNRQLADQAERLAEVDRLKTRFFVNVGHEFRTPLTLVLGPLDDLLRDTRGRLAEGVRTHLQLAQRNARRVLDLIVELLDVNRLEQGQLPLRIGVHDLAELLRRVLHESAPLVERYGQTLHLETGLSSAPARIDPAQVERCIVNLLSNAAKYSPRGTKIELSLARDGGHWVLAVRDHGRGIAPEALAHVFDRFFQAEGSDQASGYGIGLSLVREIALAHGGAVDATSELGVGSCFTLRLPADAAIPLAQPATAVAASPTPLPLPPAQDEGPDLARGRERVLVVDDHADLRTRVRELLGQRFEVLEAADGNEAWQIARDELPDLIVSDVMMPGCDGVELTRRLRAHGDTHAIGVLLLTAKVGSDHAVAGLRAGANDYLAKPFDSSELLARCEAIVAHARRLQHRLAAAAPAVPPEPIDNQDTRWRQRLDEHIAANLHESGFGVEELSARMHVDRSHLFRRCKELLGMNPSDYLRETRLAHGHRLLELGSGNVSEVAYASGFDSLSSFTRAFKTRYGVAPSQVRARAAS
ncbi:MAG TPA: response regulator [Xanthomonadales bacterium]|nr:response regulator [Xanthomonadales bacterium]